MTAKTSLAAVIVHSVAKSGHEQVERTKFLRSPGLPHQVMERRRTVSLSILLWQKLLVLCVFAVVGTGALTLALAGYEAPRPQPRPVLYWDGKTLAEVLYDVSGNMVHCRLHELEEPSDAAELIRNSGLQVRYPTFRSMLQLINNCTRHEKPPPNATSVAAVNHANSSWSTWSLWNGIMPGTKWCGVGDIAGSFDDLGTQTEVDACCRAHDHCPVKLKAFRTGYGLINFSLYTKSHCDCDKDFYSCLKTSTNKLSDMVGNFYFNIMKVQCIKEHRPFVCIENGTDISGSQNCIKWGADPDSKNMQITATQLKY